MAKHIAAPVTNKVTLPEFLSRELLKEIALYNANRVIVSRLSLGKNVLKNITFTAKEKSIIDKIKIVAKKLGITVYMAGGIVRDRLLGRKGSDFDFVVDEGADKLVTALVKEYDLSQPVLYGRSKAMSITIDGEPIDIINAERVITPLKEDEALDGPEEFSVSFDDVYRRDLTINSLLYDIEKEEVIDYTGQGLKDLQEGNIETIIDPAIKFRIHAADILRALRFAVTLGFSLSDEMKKAMRKNASRLTPRDRGGDISNRRIRRDLRKAADTPEHWQKMKTLLAEVGLFDVLTADIEDVEDDLRGKIPYTYK